MRHRSRYRQPAGRRFLSVGGGVFSPASLPGLAVWFDPAFGLFQERTGASATTPAAAAADPVGTWRARNVAVYLTAPADAARPTLRFSGTRPYLEFDGTDDQLLNSTAPADWDSSPHTWYATATGNAGAEAVGLASTYNAGASAGLSYGWLASGAPCAIKNFTAAEGVAGINGDGTWRRWAWRSPGVSGGALAVWTARRDGTDVAGAGAMTGIVDEGAGVYVGSGGINASRFTDNLGHLLLYAAELTDGQLDALDVYFASHLG